MRNRFATLAVLFALPLTAQPSIDTLIEQIEKWAGLEERRLALDTRLTAAERLRVIAPAAARRLLEGGLTLLQQNPGGEPDYFTYRLLKDYAAIDLDAAERAFAGVKDRVSAYTALIDQATRQRDFSRAARLARSALQAGHYSMGAIAFLIKVLAEDDPRQAAALQDELLRAFPREASFTNVRSLFVYVGQAPPVDAKRGRRAARLAFRALDRPGIRKTNSRGEDTATFTLKDRKIETKTSYETNLLTAAAFLAVFDPREYRRREAVLPEWKSSLAGLSAADLPELLKAEHVLRRPPEKRPADPPPPPLRDRTKMSYDELIAFAGTLPPLHRLAYLREASLRTGIAEGQRERACRLALESAALLRPESTRYLFTGNVFDLIVEKRIDALFPAALTQWLIALDAGARSEDRMVLNHHDTGVFRRRYAALARLLDERGISLPEPNPGIEAQRALREIERLRLPAQDFALPTQDGAVVRLTDLRGKVVVLDFWATWCEPCRKVLPVVAKLDREWSGKGVAVFGIDDEPPEVVRAFAAKNGLGYPTLIDRGRKVHDLFGVQGIPAAIVIGRDGRLVERVPFPHNDETFRAALKKADVE